MANFVHTNHDGIVWHNAGRVNRHSGPTADSNTVIDTINANQPVTVLCYSHGDTQSFTAPDGHTYTSDAWDFVVTSDQDAGGFVNDVHINTGGDIRKQLPVTCSVLAQRLQRQSSV